jgi:hypothetical protein
MVVAFDSFIDSLDAGTTSRIRTRLVERLLASPYPAPSVLAMCGRSVDLSWRSSKGCARVFSYAGGAAAPAQLQTSVSESRRHGMTK